MSTRRRKPVATCIVAGLVAGQLACASPSLTLETDTPLATAGFYQLRWEDSAIATRLVEATDPSFSDGRVIYAGPDTARLMSGKPDGEYYYRLESVADAGTSHALPASETLNVTVRHHSLARAFAFFAVGAAVFLATLGLIVFGGRIERG